MTPAHCVKKLCKCQGYHHMVQEATHRAHWAGMNRCGVAAAGWELAETSGRGDARC